MNNKKSPIHQIFTGIYIVLAVVTLMPNAYVSKACMLNYKAICSFSPISTIILIGLAGLHIFLEWKTAKPTKNTSS